MTETTIDHPATFLETDLAARAVDAVKVYGKGKCISLRAVTYYYDEMALKDAWGVHC